MTRRAAVGLRIAFSALLVFLLVRWVGSENAWRAVRSVDPMHWLAAVAGFVVIHVGCALKWRFTVAGFGADIRAGDAVRAHGAGLASNFILPSIVGGDVFRAGFALRSGARPEGLILGSLTDRILDAAALGVLFAGGAVLRRDDRAGFAAAVTVLAIVGLIVGFKAAAAIPWTRVLPLSRRRAALRIRVAARRMPTERLVRAFGASVALQGCLLFINIRLAAGSGFPSDPAPWLVAWPAAKLSAMLPVSFGGLGVREAAWAALAAPLGFDRAAAVAQSLVWQSVLMAGGAVGGLWSAWPRATVAPGARP